MVGSKRCRSAVLLVAFAGLGACSSPPSLPDASGTAGSGDATETGDPSTDGGPGGATEGMTEGAATEPTATDTDPDPTSGVDSSTGDTDGAVPDWGEGDPPDFGDLGPEGEGRILVVHALDGDDVVDVWLVGEATPRFTDLAPGDAVRLEGIPRDARRVVLARRETLEAVGCSEWFPLRAGEQWATVAAHDPHTCPSPVGTGATLTFEQELPLSGNPLRMVHAGAPDDLTVLRGGSPEPGTLSPLQTLSVTDLPNCEVSGCAIRYELHSDPLALTREFTFLATRVADVPPPGEVLLVVAGDIREDWPTEPDALRMLRVDVDGDARWIERDPELAVFTYGVEADVVFSVPAVPGSFDFAAVSECFDTCPLPVQRFDPGSLPITATPVGQSSTVETVALAAGRRYLLGYTDAGGGQLVLFEDAFDHADETVALGRGINFFTADTLTIGRVFGGQGVAFDAFVAIPSLSVSGEDDLPTDGWQMVSASGNEQLGTSCFWSVSTPAGWRGLLSDDLALAVDVWPPVYRALLYACF